MTELHPRAGRPFSVIFLLFVLCVCFLVGLSRLPTALSALNLNTLWLLFYMTLLIGALWNIIKRRELGRKLGLICIGLFFGVVVYQVFYEPSYAARPEILRPANAAQEGGAFFARLAMVPLMAFWFYRFGFSNRSKEYFRDQPILSEN